jgi:hypothetical protein
LAGDPSGDKNGANRGIEQILVVAASIALLSFWIHLLWVDLSVFTNPFRKDRLQ